MNKFRDFIDEDWVFYALVSIVACLIILAAIYMEKVECYAKTESIGFSRRWSFMAGCQIEVKENQWIPLDSYYFKQE